MRRSLKIFWVLLATLGLIAFMGSNSVLMASHVTHFATHYSHNNKGPCLPQNESGCLTCHAPGYLQCGEDAPLFGDAENPLPLADTDVCDTCHSPGGTYDGVNDPVIGAKANWESGVYDSEYEFLPPWQPNTEYEQGDIVTYNVSGVIHGYVAKDDFTSGSTPNGANWTWINYWQPNTQYYVGDLVRYDISGKAKIYRSRKGFETPYKPFTTGSSVNGANWELVKRAGSGKESLKLGKEKWCAGCHDEEPANSKADGMGVKAPNIIGEGSTYGFYVNGHGRDGGNGMPAIGKECLDCHDSTFAHIDHEHRTYEVLEDEFGCPEAVTHSYKDNYRLKSDMAVPRYLPEVGEDTIGTAFKLCMDVCHDAHPYVFSDVKYCLTNFVGNSPGGQSHAYHSGVGYWGAYHYVCDSDWDGIPGDSGTSCTTCHNVHGSPMQVNEVLKPNPVMIRHGELISTPGTTDKVPALDFRWTPETNVLLESIGGILRNDHGFWFVGSSHVCQSCHVEESYSRIPGGPPEIVEINIWTSDLNDEPKDSFKPNDDIRYHLDFYLTGQITEPPSQWCVRSKYPSGAWGNYPEPVVWTTPIDIDTLLPRGEHKMSWDKTIPGDAAPGKARFRMELLMGNFECTELLDSELRVYDFTIVE